MSSTCRFILSLHDALPISVHMIRTAYNRREGEVVQDKIWRDTVERTGGRFYAAYDEQSISRALRDIDRLSPGRIDVRDRKSTRLNSSHGYISYAVWYMKII